MHWWNIFNKCCNAFVACKKGN